MNTIKKIISLILLTLFAGAHLCAQEKLTGKPIGTEKGYNYERSAVENNIQWKAFDGDLGTYFATYERSYTWVGLDLGKQYVINRVGWSPRNDGLGEGRVRLGVFEGANREDFLDAIPIYIIRERGKIGTISYGDVECSRGFRYVRWVSTNDSRCNIAELEFYGTEGAGDDSHLFQITNLPTVCINTVAAEIPYDKEHDITSNITIIANNTINVDKSATVRERGNVSRSFPKKPWRIKFDKKQNVLNAPAKAKKWTLINNYGDKTLMRNMVAFELARKLDMTYVPFCQPVDVLLNGEYKGCYQLCDQVEVNENRLNITEMTPDDVNENELTGGYFFEIDAYSYEEPEQIRFSTSRGLPVTIKSPDDDEIVPAQKEYLAKYVQTLEDYIYAADATADNAGFLDIFDISSFLKLFIVNEIAGNTDTFWSTYMYKERGNDIIYTGPVWDFDIAFDNDYRTYPITQTSRTQFLAFTSKASAAGNMRDIAQRIILNNPSVRRELSKIWSYARNDNNLNAASINEFIDNVSAELAQSQQLNFLRWPILNEFVHMNPLATGSFDAEVSRLQQYITSRMAQLDDNNHMRYNAQYTSAATAIAPEKYNAYVSGRRIIIDGDTEFAVFSPDGRCLFNGRDSSPELVPGIYLVSTAAGNTSKFRIQ